MSLVKTLAARSVFVSLVALSLVACGESRVAGDIDGGGTNDTGVVRNDSNVIVLPDSVAPTDRGTTSDRGTIAFDAPRPPREAAVAVCGNGVLETGEQCDDNNMVDTDMCNNRCQRVGPRCGNRIVNEGETCDDGNNASGDGCSADCKSNETCGNNVRDIHIGEVCDDGNTMGGDSCAADCRALPACGNDTVDTNEQCDDGNTETFDSCGADCYSELGMPLMTASLGTATEGCDFSGDGRPDNALGRVLAPVAGLLQGQVQMGLRDRAALWVQGLDDRTGTADSRVQVGWIGLMAGTPFRVDPATIDADTGAPIVSFAGSIAASRFRGGPEDVSIPLGPFPLQFKQANLEATFVTTDGRVSSATNGLLCGGVQVNTFGAIPLDLLFDQLGGAVGIELPTPEACEVGVNPTLADLFVGGGSLVIFTLNGVQPDIDVDGDGLEYFEVSGGSGCQAVITACIDGDGRRIEGHDCILDPRIADGISAAVKFTARTATIVSTSTPPPLPLPDGGFVVGGDAGR